jgi:hypothetical protein
MHTAIGTRSRSGQKSNSAGGGASNGGGAFTGILRSAANAGAEKLNKHANPIAKMPRRMVHPFVQINYTLSDPERAAQAAVSRFPV